MILFPNAKINLGLDIVRRRQDGFHDIATVMIPVPWRDILEIVPARGSETTLTVTGRHVDCPPEKNLVMRAWRLMHECHGIPAVDIYLRKIIPDGAGLGGGSADAAFMLRGLNDLFGTGLDDAELCALAGELGSDCPFFILNRPMLCTGRGTDMTPVGIAPLEGFKLLIAKPHVLVSTAAAYGGCTPSGKVTPYADILAKSPAEWAPEVSNDFERSVFPAFPEIEAVKRAMLEAGAVYAAMSGSGASVFGLFEGEIPGGLTGKLADCDTFASDILADRG